MSETIIIGANKHDDYVMNKLRQYCLFLRDRGVHINYSSEKHDDYCFTHLHIDLGEENRSIFNEDRLTLCCHYIAQAVAESIMERWRSDIIGEMLAEADQFFSTSERNKIIRRCEEIIHQREVNEVTLTGSSPHKNVEEKIISYLETNNILIIDGFVKFRLKGIKSELEEVLDDAVEEFLLEKEYDDFIGLLKYFVDTQEPRIARVHVTFEPSGGFNLYNDKFRAVDSEYLEDFILDLMDNDLSYEDLLLSALITIAPEEVVLHLPGSSFDKSTTVTTIQNVFENRVTLCIGCSKCLHSNQKKL